MLVDDPNLVMRFPVTTVDGERFMVWYWRKDGFDTYRASDKILSRITAHVGKIGDYKFLIHRENNRLIAFRSALGETVADL